MVIANPVYLSQRDNVYNPYIACAPTSAAMMMLSNGVTWSADMAQLFGTDVAQLEDLLYWLCNNHPECLQYAHDQGIDINAWTDGNIESVGRADRLNQWYTVLAFACNLFLQTTCQSFSVAFHSAQTYYAAAELAITELNQGRAVLAGTNLAALIGAGGHVVCLVGYVPKGYNNNPSAQALWIINDPYGDPNTYYQSANGEGVQYLMANGAYVGFTFMLFCQPNQ